MSTLSFSGRDSVTNMLAAMPSPLNASMDAARTRQGQLTKPAGSLGRLEELAIWMAGWHGNERPAINHPRCVVFAGNHGITAKGVSAFPADVTRQMVANFDAGGAAINQLCQANGVLLDVHSIRLDEPTGDISEKAAMEHDEALAAMKTGADALIEGTDLLLVGEMGIGNTTSAAALALATLGGDAATWTGPGTGLDSAGVSHKSRLVGQAVERHRKDHHEPHHDRQDHSGQERGGHPVELLASLGGHELAAIAGAVLAARMKRIPVLLDGFAATAACLPLWAANRTALDHCQIAHVSKEPGHRHLLAAINRNALLDLDMRLGEASAAALALPIVKLALAVHNGMATFAEAGVSDGT